MSDLVGEWQSETDLGFGNNAKRQQPNVIKKAVVGRNTQRRCQKINMVATVVVTASKTPGVLFSWLELEIFIVCTGISDCLKAFNSILRFLVL